MISLFLRGNDRKSSESGAPARRSDQLRRTTLAVNAQIMIATAALLLPLALYAAVRGQLLPGLLDALVIATGFLTLMTLHRGASEAAAATGAYGMLAAGAVLTLADPAIADFGLAIALLAPIHAALLSKPKTKQLVWIGLALVLALGVAAGLHIGGLDLGRDAPSGLTGGLAFAVMGLVVAHTANRLNTAFEVYDRAQINAYRHLLEHVQDAVMRFSAEGDLLFASNSSERLFGCKRYELFGDGLLERIHVLDRPAYLTALADANRAGKTRTIELRMRQELPGSIGAPQFVWIEMALSPVLDNEASGTPSEVVALLRDVTDRRDQENAMRAARQAAEDASEAKSRFLATIGHELRTPLNAIVGFSEMMTSNIGGDLSPAHREYAELIRKSGMHLIDVVGMLLDMSRIEAGKFELQAESFAAEGLIEPCLHMVDPLARDKQVRFSTQLSPGLPPIVADERACRQILINLLSNAIKFSPERGMVTIGMRRQGDFLALSVADHGIGMSAEAVSRIGEPFFQAQDGLARRYEGTGLGLSIVKGLVDLHHGSLRTTSVPGNGTTMTVLLPINGPETKMPETSSVTPLRRETASQPETQWPEQKRSAR